MPKWKRGKHGMLLPQPNPKFTSRLVPDTQEKMKEAKGKQVIDEEKADRCGWQAGTTDIIPPTYKPGHTRTTSGEPGFIKVFDDTATPIDYDLSYVPLEFYELAACEATKYAK
eukprot:4834036-Pyramimonas_sp.AAC.1